MNQPPFYSHVEIMPFWQRAFVSALLVALLFFTIRAFFDLAFVEGIVLGLATYAVQVLSQGMGAFRVEVTAGELRFGYSLWGVHGMGRLGRAQIARVSVRSLSFLDRVRLNLNPWAIRVLAYKDGPAVAVEKKNGGTLYLGVDDPDGLLRALGAEGTT